MRRDRNAKRITALIIARSLSSSLKKKKKKKNTPLPRTLSPASGGPATHDAIVQPLILTLVIGNFSTGDQSVSQPGGSARTEDDDSTGRFLLLF